MADVDPKVFPNDSIKVMILPSPEIYRQRLEERDVAQASKRDQGGLEYKYDEFKEWASKFEYVIQNDGTPEEALDEILNVKE